jgi:thymidylate kinase
MIVEFIGMPGSGKTFFANRLVVQLKSIGYNSINITESSRENYKCKIIRKLLYVSINLLQCSKSHKQAIERLLRSKSYGSSIFGIYSSPTYCINTISIQIMIYSILSSSKKIYIFDEGVMYTLVKLITDFNFPLEDVESIKNYILNQINSLNILTIYYKSKKEDCYASILKRNRNSCKFDMIKGSDLDNILSRYQENCELIQSNMKISLISRNEDESKKISRILNLIINSST